jgi:hypothetical protein
MMSGKGNKVSCSIVEAVIELCARVGELQVFKLRNENKSEFLK